MLPGFFIHITLPLISVNQFIHRLIDLKQGIAVYIVDIAMRTNLELFYKRQSFPYRASAPFEILVDF
jgi:hypothetical protein